MKKVFLTGFAALCALSCAISIASCSPAFAKSASTPGIQGRVEHLKTGSVKGVDLNKKSKTDAKSNIVRITKSGSVIQKENVLYIAFSENFNSKYYKKGDMVQFTFTDDVKTEEGTLLIPKNSNLIGAIDTLERPKYFSRNAKVTIDFMYILTPDGRRLEADMELANGKGYLARGPKATAGKIAAYTLGIGGTGAGLGAAIGTASSNTIPGLIIGGSIGGGVGLVSGIVTKGLHYKAKKGYFIPIRLEENLQVPNL